MTHNLSKTQAILGIVVASIIILGGIRAGLIYAGDQRWATLAQLSQIEQKVGKKVDQIEINALDRQITFLQIKIDQGEASNSDKIFMEALKLQLRQLQN